MFAINLAVILLGIVYWQDAEHRGVMPHDADTAIKVATSAGAIFGQCIFGYMGDLLGRKKMYGVELMIIISTTLAQALAGESTTLSVVGVLIFYRVVMGIGVGGDCKSLLSIRFKCLCASLLISTDNNQTRSVQSLLRNSPAPGTEEVSSQQYSPCKVLASSLLHW